MNTKVLHGSVAGAVGSPEAPNGVLEAPSGNLRFADWLYRSKAASVVWLVARLWLGYQWLNAGYQKLWGAEKAGFWTNGGAGVKGFATAGVTGWFAAFLHNFVVPNASWIAKLVTLSELAIGVLLILGLFTGAAAFAGISLNVVYMFSGVSGVNPAFFLVSVLLILAWRNAGYLGLDRYALPAARNLFHRGIQVKGTEPMPKVAIPVH